MLINVDVASKEGFETSEAIKAAIMQSEQRLGNDGRVLVRVSGTESLIRVMTEAKDIQSAKKEADLLVDCVKQGRG